MQTPARRVQLNVDPCSQSGKVYVVPEEGLRAADTLPGDLIVHTAIRVPDTLTWRQKRVLKKFAKLEIVESDKLVNDIMNDSDHKLLINVIEADVITNKVVPKEKIDPFQRTITQTLRDKLGIKTPEKKKPAYPYHYHRIFSI